MQPGDEREWDASLADSSGEPRLLGGPLEPRHVPAGKSGPEAPSAVSPPPPAPGGICMLKRWMIRAPGGIYSQLLLNMFAKGCHFEGERVQTAGVTQTPSSAPLGMMAAESLAMGSSMGSSALGSTRKLGSHMGVPVPGFLRLKGLRPSVQIGPSSRGVLPNEKNLRSILVV